MLGTLLGLIFLGRLVSAHECCSQKKNEDDCVFDNLDCDVQCVYREVNKHCECVLMTSANTNEASCQAMHVHEDVWESRTLAVIVIIATVIVCIALIVFICCWNRNSGKTDAEPDDGVAMIQLAGDIKAKPLNSAGHPTVYVF